MPCGCCGVVGVGVGACRTNTLGCGCVGCGVWGGRCEEVDQWAMRWQERRGKRDERAVCVACGVWACRGLRGLAGPCIHRLRSLTVSLLLTFGHEKSLTHALTSPQLPHPAKAARQRKHALHFAPLSPPALCSATPHSQLNVPGVLYPPSPICAFTTHSDSPHAQTQIPSTTTAARSQGKPSMFGKAGLTRFQDFLGGTYIASMPVQFVPPFGIRIMSPHHAPPQPRPGRARPWRLRPPLPRVVPQPGRGHALLFPTLRPHVQGEPERRLEPVHVQHLRRGAQQQPPAVPVRPPLRRPRAGRQRQHGPRPPVCLRGLRAGRRRPPEAKRARGQGKDGRWFVDPPTRHLVCTACAPNPSTIHKHVQLRASDTRVLKLEAQVEELRRKCDQALKGEREMRHMYAKKEQDFAR